MQTGPSFRSSPFLTLLATLFAALLAATITLTPASARAVTGDEARSLLRIDGQELAVEGWKFVDVRTNSQKAVYSFDNKDGWTLNVVVEALASGRPFYAASDSLAISYQLPEFEPGPEVRVQVESLMKAVVEAVRLNDRPGLFPGAGSTAKGPEPGATRPDRAEPAGGEGESGLTGAGANLLRLDMLLWLLFLIPLSFAGRVAWKNIATWRPHEWVLVGTMVMASALIRLVVVPHVLVKVGMAYPLMDSAIGLEQLPRYGAVASVLYHFLFQLFPVHVATVLYFHTGLSIANVVLLLVFARRHLDSGGATLLLALLLCFTPVFLRDGNSESILVPGMFLLVTGALVLQEYMATGRRYLLAVALPAAVLAAHLRPEFLLVTPLFLAAAVIPSLRLERKRILELSAFFAGLALLVVPYVLFFTEVLSAELARGNLTGDKLNIASMMAQLFQRNMLIRPGIFPPVISVFALATVVASLVRKEHRLRVIPLLVLGLAWLTVYYVDFNEESMLRLHVPPAMIFAILAAYAVPLLDRRRKGLWPKLVLGAVFSVAFTISVATTSFNVFFESNSALQDGYFDELVEALPAEDITMVVLTGRDEPFHAWSPATLAEAGPDFQGAAMVHRYIPEYLLRPPLRNDRVISISEYATSQEVSGRVLFYLSPHCYAMRENHGEEQWNILADPYLKLHPACRWMLTTHHLVPVRLVHTSNHSEFSPPFRWYPEGLGGFTVGLLEIEGTMDGEPARYSMAGIAGHYFARAKPFLEKHDFEAALPVLEEGQEVLGENSATMWEYMGDYYFLAGALAGDRDMLRSAFNFRVAIADRDVHYPYLLKNLSSVYSMYSEYLTDEEVLEFVDDRLARNQEDVIGLMLKGMLLFYNKKDYEGALSHLEQILDTIDTDPRVYVYISLCHFYLGHQSRAEAMVERSIEVCGGTDPDAYYVRSIIYRQKNLPQAIKDIEQYLEMSEGPDKVKYEKKQQWLKKELENLKQGKMSPWWRTKGTDDEPWKDAE